MRHANLICGMFLVWVFVCPVLFSAHADESDLSNGVFIVHNPPGLQFSDFPPPEGWCEHYESNFAISSCEEQNPRIDVTSGSVWYVLAAWCEEKEWCGNEFGFADYDPTIYDFVEWGPCAPGGFLEIPSDYWPGPNEGTAFVATDMFWVGNFVPIYYFTGYAYSGGVIPLGPDPPTDFVGFCNCLVPPELWEPVCIPAMGILMDGVECCPAQPSPVGDPTWGKIKHLFR